MCLDNSEDNSILGISTGCACHGLYSMHSTLSRAKNALDLIPSQRKIISYIFHFIISTMHFLSLTTSRICLWLLLHFQSWIRFGRIRYFRRSFNCRMLMMLSYDFTVLLDIDEFFVLRVFQIIEKIPKSTSCHIHVVFLVYELRLVRLDC